MEKEKNIRILFTSGIDTTRYDCYSEGWSETICDLLTFEPVISLDRILSSGEDFVILVGEKWSEEGPGYNEPTGVIAILYTYHRLVAAGFSNNDAIRELLRFYNTTPLLSEKPTCMKHADYWDKKYILPGNKAEVVIEMEEARRLALISKEAS